MILYRIAIRGCPDNSQAASFIILSVLLFTALPSQRRRLTLLLNRHDDCGNNVCQHTKSCNSE